MKIKQNAFLFIFMCTKTNKLTFGYKNVYN